MISGAGIDMYAFYWRPLPHAHYTMQLLGIWSSIHYNNDAAQAILVVLAHVLLNLLQCTASFLGTRDVPINTALEARAQYIKIMVHIIMN